MQPSGKYLNLEKAQQAGIATPKTLLLDKGKPDTIQGFINSCGVNSRFIIRSIQACEDGDKKSYAGHFWSSPAVPANAVTATIKQAEQENQLILNRLGITEAPQLMLQEFIEHDTGGVLFSPWGFFQDYCFVEYSTVSVQEVVNVGGEPAILCLNKSAYPPLPLPEPLLFIETELRSLCQSLQTRFNFPLDCEWAYDSQKQHIVLLQLRPQTRMTGALFNTSHPAYQQAAAQLNLLAGDWQFTALSESVGKLSPLSFSLLKKLYEDARSSFQSLGYKAKSVDFLFRLPDGSVLVEAERERQFFSTSFTGGFWRGFKAPQWQQKICKQIKQYHETSDFSYNTLASLFQNWMVSNLLSQGEGRKQVPAAHAYELSWQQHIKLPPQNNVEKNTSFAGLNAICRSLFFHELQKLKRHISHNKKQVFMLWEEYSTKPVSPVDNATLEKRQATDAKLALYDFSLLKSKTNANPGSNTQSIGAKKAVTGSVFKIENPARHQQNIPQNCILVSPYFDNQWVHDIPNIKAILVEKGGQLSHSAIIARENDVPYFIIPHTILNQLKQGQSIKLSKSGMITRQ